MRPWFNFASRKEQMTDGVNDAWLLTTHSFARENSDVSPYLVPNEWICGNIGRMLGLPVPPFALFRTGKKTKPMFGSLDFRYSESPPPDTNPAKCVDRMPRECAGLVVFDIFIANADRHAGNIVVDNPNNPTEIHMFDHDRALFGYVKGQGAARLQKVENRLGVSGGSQSTGNAHCMLEHLSSSDDLSEWCQRIATIPIWQIEDICKSECVPSRLREAAISFLRSRRNNIGQLIMANKDAFPNIKDWGLWV
jgi:hypothetical protein